MKNGIDPIGHSLGAGTSVILGLMLRSKYPDLKVYAFACPGKYNKNTTVVLKKSAETSVHI